MTNTISFPKLNLAWDINPVAFSIGSKPIYWYALVILAGFLLAIVLVTSTCKKRGVESETVFDIAIYGLIFGVIFARLYYVIFSFDEFRDNLWDIIKTWEGGLAIYGGLIGAALAALVYCKIKKLDTLQVFDVCAPGLLLGQAIGRYGNFLNAEVYGRKTDVLWGMSINGAAPVHPLFFYESVWNLLGLALILIFRDKKTAHGQVFFFYAFWYSLGRFFLEGMRQSQYILFLVEDKLAASQVVALVIMAAAIIGFAIVTFRKKEQSGAVQ